MRDILGATQVGEGLTPAKWETGPLFVSSSIGSKRDGHWSGSSVKDSSAKSGEVSVLLATYGES